MLLTTVVASVITFVISISKPGGSDRMIEQVNSQTEDYSCPAGYTAVELYSGVDTFIGAYTT